MIAFEPADQIKILLDQQEKLYARQSELKALLEDCDASENYCDDDGASTAVENWSGSFGWDSRADDVRLNIFGISSYRANQREVIILSSLSYTLIIVRLHSLYDVWTLDFLPHNRLK